MRDADGRKVVLVTGASSGIGRACADRLARRGYRVFGTARAAADPPDAAPDPATGVTLLRMDARDDRSVARAAAEVLRRAGGRVDAVVNNAGVALAGAAEDTSDAEALDLLQTNLLGPLRVCRAVLPAMRAAGGGTIVNVGSIAGRVPLPFQGVYSASKAALASLSDALRAEVRPFGVRVVLVEPGDVRTPITDRRATAVAAAANPAYRDRLGRAVAVAAADERGGPGPEAVARVVGRVLAARRPGPRYTAGPAGQRVAAALAGVLPARLLGAAVARYYRVR